MAAAEEGVEPLKYQTWILKVSIHCEGCKKKVKKVLQSMEGVYKTTVDPQQHKVVVTGNVEAEILIKKLLKAGKHAELWPEKKPNEDNNSGSGGGGGGGGNSKKNKGKNSNKPNEASENLDNNKSSPGNGIPSQVSNKSESEASKNGGKESSPPPKKEDEGEKSTVTEGGGKKKGKKDQKEKKNNNNNNSSSSSCDKNKNNGGSDSGSAADVEVVSREANKKAVSGGDGGGAMPPAFNFPLYATPQMPSYLMSYSSMQPSMSYGGAYYTALPMIQSSYVYSAPSPCSYYTFSEENANVCSIM